MNNGANRRGRLKKSEMIYEMLKSEIQKGKYLPGQRITEDEVAREYDTSRNTARVALTKLEKDGVIQRTSSGLIVALTDVRDAIEILEIRELIEGYLTRRAASRISEAALNRLHDVLTEMEKVLMENRYSEYSRLNEQFHSIIYDASNSRIGVQILHNLRIKLIRYQFRTIMIPGRAPLSLKEHRQIYLALMNRNEEDAERAARLHVANVRELIRNYSQLLDLRESQV
jgi:DNA-binding GntR family transcriptional regulator